MIAWKVGWGSWFDAGLDFELVWVSSNRNFDWIRHGLEGIGFGSWESRFGFWFRAGIIGGGGDGMG